MAGDPRRAAHAPAPVPRKKRYSAPKLETYGHVSKLTAAKGATNADGGNPGRRAANCL